jgi:hypothetical protein
MSSQPSFYYSANEYLEPEPELDLNLDVLTTQLVLNSFNNNLFNTDFDLNFDLGNYEIDNDSLSKLSNSDNNIFNKSFIIRFNLILLFLKAIYSSKQKQINSI